MIHPCLFSTWLDEGVAADLPPPGSCYCVTAGALHFINLDIANSLIDSIEQTMSYRTYEPVSR